MLQKHKPATALLPSGTSQTHVMAGAAADDKGTAGLESGGFQTLSNQQRNLLWSHMATLLLKSLWVLFIGLTDLAAAVACGPISSSPEWDLWALLDRSGLWPAISFEQDTSQHQQSLKFAVPGGSLNNDDRAWADTSHSSRLNPLTTEHVQRHPTQVLHSIQWEFFTGICLVHPPLVLCVHECDYDIVNELGMLLS